MNQDYINEYEFIWKTYVPSTGQSTVLQGELLRQIEKLRHEGRNNGNINWGTDFEFFCDFLSQHLSASDSIPSDLKNKVVDILSKFKKVGQAKADYFNGLMSEEEANTYPLGFAYVEEEMYNLVTKAIIMFSLANKEPIPYEPNPNIHR